MKKAITGAVLSLVFLAPSFSYAAFDTNLKYGSTGSKVTELQEFLTDQGVYSGPVSGNFYALTRVAVKAYQSKNGIVPASGFWGPMTRKIAQAVLDEQDATANDAEVKETGTTTPATGGETVAPQPAPVVVQPTPVVANPVVQPVPVVSEPVVPAAPVINHDLVGVNGDGSISTLPSHYDPQGSATYDQTTGELVYTGNMYPAEANWNVMVTDTVTQARSSLPIRIVSNVVSGNTVTQRLKFNLPSSTNPLEVRAQVTFRYQGTLILSAGADLNFDASGNYIH